MKRILRTKKYYNNKETGVMSYFSDLDMYLFGQSTHYDIYKKLGAHLMTHKRKKGVMFDLWAPGAKRVWVIGNFNNWDETAHEMERLEPEACGIYELFVPGVEQIGRASCRERV